MLGRLKVIMLLMLRRQSLLKKWRLALPSQSFGGGTGLTTAAISCGRCGETFSRQRLMCLSARSSAALHSHTRLTTAHFGRSGEKPVGLWTLTVQVLRTSDTSSGQVRNLADLTEVPPCYLKVFALVEFCPVPTSGSVIEAKAHAYMRVHLLFV